MDSNQMLVLALANVPTAIALLIGIILINGRFHDMNSRMTSLEDRMGRLEHKLDTHFEVLLGKIEELDNRLTSRGL